MADINSEKRDQNSREDKKAGKVFAVIIVASMAAGAVIGGFSNFFADNMGAVLTAAVQYFVEYVAPFGSLAVSTVALIIFIVLYRRSQREYQAWDQEDEIVIDALENRMNYALLVVSVAMILAFFFFAAVCSLVSRDDFSMIAMAFSLLGLIYTLIVITIIQQKIVNFEKEINPEKSGSVYDVNFNKKWLKSCDEAEKLQIYQSAYTAYKATNMTCMLLWLVCVIGSTVADTGILPAALVTIIWLVQMVSYSLKAISLSKNKIRG